MDKLIMCENGGCLAKLSGGKLARLIGEVFGNYSPEDSSLFTLDGTNMLFTVDFGPLVGDDPFVAGKIAALHALSDIYVSAGIPKCASLILQLSDDVTYEQTKSILYGIKTVCDSEKIQILGGHTIKSETSIVGLSVIGLANERYLSRSKKQCSVGDVLMISKKIGTGIATRAYFHNIIDQKMYSEAVDSMMISNSNVLNVYSNLPVHSCTDITGFGLLGHISEMLPNGMGAKIYKDKVKIFDCIKELPADAFFTSFINDNINYVMRAKNCDIRFDSIDSLALVDPQTNGPVLLAIEPQYADLASKYGFYEIGEVNDSNNISIR